MNTTVPVEQRDKFVVITADDFGLHEAVNEAVDRAHRFGVLTAASLMIGAPAAQEAVRIARDLPSLRVGLHVVLADGHATLAPRLVRRLTDEHGHMDGRMFVRGLRYFALPQVRAQVEAEIRAQFAAFARTGLPLDHVNVHKHFHLHPSILDLLLRVARDYGVPPVRLPYEPLWFAARCGGVAAVGAAAVLHPWLALVKRRLRRARVLHNDRVFGVSASGAMDESRLLDVIKRLPRGLSEIYLHPAADRGQPMTPSMSAYRHADELAALLSPRVRSSLEASAAARGGFSDFRRGR